MESWRGVADGVMFKTVSSTEDRVMTGFFPHLFRKVTGRVQTLKVRAVGSYRTVTEPGKTHRNVIFYEKNRQLTSASNKKPEMKIHSRAKVISLHLILIS